MKILLLVPLLLSCATAPLTTSVHPFGPNTYTTSSSTRMGLPNLVRDRVIREASDFCRARKQRSLPIDINLITLPQTTHAATIVFRCFDLWTLEEAL